MPSLAQIHGLDRLQQAQKMGIMPPIEDTSGGELEAVLTQDTHLQRLLIEEEAFMNEVVEVYVHPSTNENDPPQFILSVNGINQPVFRGSITPIKRKYLEVLARMKETKFSQNQEAPGEARNALIPRTAFVYPFEIRRDPNPRGAAWLYAIMAENQ